MPENPLSIDLNHILDHTRDFWEELRGERLFITGGTGFFGCWLLESLLWANKRLNLGAHAIILTRSKDAFFIKVPHLASADCITLLEGDIRTFPFPAGMFSHILHVATQPEDVSPKFNVIDQFHANINGTERVLEFAQVSGAQKFLFTSSGAVYGKQPPDMRYISEDYAGAPYTTDVGSAYGQSKRVSEYLCTTYAQKYGFTFALARCFAFVGPYLSLNANYAIGNFIRDSLTGGPVFIQGDGTPVRSYLYSADLAIWLWVILFKGQSAHPYNVGSENDISISDLGRVVADEIFPEANVIIAGEPVVGRPGARYVPSTQRAKSELGLESWIPLNEAIRRTTKFYSR